MMSYNPAIHGKNKPVARRQRKLNPHAGIKHSDIVARKGYRPETAMYLEEKIPTERGWKVVHFAGKDFEMVYEYICMHNSTGRVKHRSADRSLRVLNGELYVELKDKDIIKLTQGQVFAFPRKTEYQLATSGLGDAEVLFCQGTNYEEGLTCISVAATNQVPSVKEVIEREKAAIRNRVPGAKAKQQAAKIASRRKRRDQAKQSNTQVPEGGQVTPKSPPKTLLPGQQVTGRSPMPMGAAGAAALSD